MTLTVAPPLPLVEETDNHPAGPLITAGVAVQVYVPVPLNRIDNGCCTGPDDGEAARFTASGDADRRPLPGATGDSFRMW